MVLLLAVALCGSLAACFGQAEVEGKATATIFGNRVPTVVADPDTKPVELGVRFTTSTDGEVTGIRFYKSAQNTGAHQGTLWSKDGKALATATFTGESASGWQSVEFSSPVKVKAGTTYVASYHTNTGYYSADSGFFGTTTTNGPLKAPADRPGARNSVYAYGNKTTFPTQSWAKANYWVDVTFSYDPGGEAAAPTAPTTTAPPATTSTTAAPATTSTTKAPTTTTTAAPAPNVPSGAPSGARANATNTGYKNAPGYPGSLQKCSGPIQSNTTYRFCDFSGGLGIGSANDHPVNVTFYGCRFASNAVVDANVANYGDNITFDYSTFEPSADSAPPTDYRQGYQYGIDQRYAGRLTVDHSDFWGWGNGIQFGFSSQEKPLVVRNSWFHDARSDGGGVDHTDAILSNEGGPSYMVFDNNTIASNGNTQGLALQTERRGYDHVTITNNYFSGFGYTVAIGENLKSTNITFTGNTFGTDFKPVWGVLYSAADWNYAATGNLWRNNRWDVVPGSYYSPATDDGKFWLPSGAKSTADHTG